MRLYHTFFFRRNHLKQICLRRLPAKLVYFLVCFLTLPYSAVFAQPPTQTISQTTQSTFELKNGDRVVFLGNSLFENDLPYGYLELALTTRWPNRNITYRNIGWSGDTVWGDARSYISPPTNYDLLIEQLTQTRPTVVFVAYGAMEAVEGGQGLSRFTQGLTQLLDKIAQLGAKAILISPVPVMSASTTEDTEKRNTMLKLYATAIAKMAAERNIPYIDVFKPMLEHSKEVKLSDNGFHLNEQGYYYLATTIERNLGFAPRSMSTFLDVSKQTVDTKSTVKILDWGKKDGNIRFTMDEAYLPLPLPKQSAGTANKTQVLQITGLKKGVYTLTTDDAQVVTASAKDWKEGVEIKQGASFNQVNQLREMIVKKNELFFHQYRPQNKTYILGFRSHEQGRHVKGLEELSIIITWLEGQIALQSLPKTRVYQLSPIN